MSYILHTWPDTAGLIVRITLEELGLPYTATIIDRPNGALDSPAYRALQPLGKIPALETPDGPMFETAAMLLYLSEKHHALAPAPGTPDRAAFLKWFIFATNELHPTVLQLHYPERVAGPGNAAAVTQIAAARLKEGLTLLDTMVAATAPAWLSPDAPSVLGIYVGTLMRWIMQLPPGHPARLPTRDFPALHRVLLALEARPAVQKAAIADGLTDRAIFTDPS